MSIAEKQTIPVDIPAAFIASQADLDAGLEHGAWVDMSMEQSDIRHDVRRILRTSSGGRQSNDLVAGWAIQASAGFGPLEIKPHEPLEVVGNIGRAISRHGLAFAGWAAIVGSKYAASDARSFMEAYVGSFDSEQAYAEYAAEDLGWPAVLDVLPSALRPYIGLSTDKFIQDLRQELSFAQDGDGVWVYRHSR